MKLLIKPIDDWPNENPNKSDFGFTDSSQILRSGKWIGEWIRCSWADSGRMKTLKFFNLWFRLFDMNEILFLRWIWFASKAFQEAQQAESNFTPQAMVEFKTASWNGRFWMDEWRPLSQIPCDHLRSLGEKWFTDGKQSERNRRLELRRNRWNPGELKKNLNFKKYWKYSNSIAVS